jgi:D-alanyl-D-alanine dipeptidase
MKKAEVYELLEDKMLRYSDLASQAVVPSGEPMVGVLETPNLSVKPIDPDMAKFTGNEIYVRKSVAERLGEASLTLTSFNADYRLQIVYGYRALSIQTAKYQKIKQGLTDEYADMELMEAVHRMVAVPEVAGHPTGGAVDVQIAQGGKLLNFGTKILEFVPDTYTFSPFIDREAWFNRQLLRRCMTSSGFAPFDGEWWHFSYGDKEWATFYNQPNAVYEQIEFSSLQNTL